jgi:outer membrane usher protein FimD/PapC
MERERESEVRKLAVKNCELRTRVNLTIAKFYETKGWSMTSSMDSISFQRRRSYWQYAISRWIELRGC